MDDDLVGFFWLGVRIVANFRHIFEGKLTLVYLFDHQGTEGFKNAKKGTNVAGQAAGLAAAKVRILIVFVIHLFQSFIYCI